MDAAKKVIEGLLPDRTAGRYPAHIPGRLRNVIRMALRPDPDERHQEVLGLINDLGKVDEWLDWLYEWAGAVERWSTKSESHKKVVVLTHASNNVYKVRVKTIRARDGQERNRQALSGDTDTRARAQRMVRNALTSL